MKKYVKNCVVLFKSWKHVRKQSFLNFQTVVRRKEDIFCRALPAYPFIVKPSLTLTKPWPLIRKRNVSLKIPTLGNRSLPPYPLTSLPTPTSLPKSPTVPPPLLFLRLLRCRRRRRRQHRISMLPRPPPLARMGDIRGPLEVQGLLHRILLSNR